MLKVTNTCPRTRAVLLPLMLHHYLPPSQSQAARRLHGAGAVDLCSERCIEATTPPEPAKVRAISVAANPEIWGLALRYAAVLQHHHGSVLALCFGLLQNCVCYPLLGQYFRDLMVPSAAYYHQQCNTY